MSSGVRVVHVVEPTGLGREREREREWFIQEGNRMCNSMMCIRVPLQTTQRTQWRRTTAAQMLAALGSHLLRPCRRKGGRQ